MLLPRTWKLSMLHSQTVASQCHQHEILATVFASSNLSSVRAFRFEITYNEVPAANPLNPPHQAPSAEHYRWSRYYHPLKAFTPVERIRAASTVFPSTISHSQQGGWCTRGCIPKSSRSFFQPVCIIHLSISTVYTCRKGKKERTMPALAT